MSLYYQDDYVTLYHGDCVEVMRTIPAESVDAIVTSPPYAEQRKSTYGGISENGYPEWTVAWMAEAWRVLKPNGSALINIRPHIRNGQISDYVLRTRLALREAGWNECEELIWHKTTAPPMGSPARPRRAYEHILWYAKHGRPYSAPKAGGIVMHRADRKSGGSEAPQIHILNGLRLKPQAIARVTDVAVFPPDNSGSAQSARHPAPFPWKLAEWMGKLVCPPGGTILDSFSGSGSTGVAALRNGWNFIGIDAVEEYVQMSRERLKGDAA